MPWLDRVLTKNPIWLKLFAKPIQSPVIGFGQRRLMERLNSDVDTEEEITTLAEPELQAKNLAGTQSSKPDFLSRFLTAREEAADAINDKQLLGYLFVSGPKTFVQQFMLT